MKVLPHEVQNSILEAQRFGKCHSLRRVRDIWATIWRRSHGRQKCRPNGLINWIIYLKRLAYLIYGSVASPPSPSSNIEASPYGLSLRFAPAFRAPGVCEHIWPFSLRDIWATLLSSKWAEIFVAQMAGDETFLPPLRKFVRKSARPGTELSASFSVRAVFISNIILPFSDIVVVIFKSTPVKRILWKYFDRRVASLVGIVADMGFPTFVADHGCVSSQTWWYTWQLIDDEDPCYLIVRKI